jgi:hypothetical protein
VKCNILLKGELLQLTTCACYSWQTALNIGIDVQLDNMKNLKVIIEKAGKVYSTKAYVTNDEIC